MPPEIHLLQVLVCSVICAFAGALSSGYIARQCAAWYHVSERGGASGYLIMFLGLFGFSAGGVIGMVAGFSVEGVGLQLGAGVASVFALSAAGWAVARAGGDIPPKIGSDELSVLIELRCPAGWTPDDKAQAGKNTLRLSSINASGIQISEWTGSIEWNEARTEDGHLIIPGSVFLYRASPKRAIRITLGDEEIAFLLALRSRPESEDEAWTDWLPRVSDADPVGRGFRFRYRVVRETELANRREGAAEDCSNGEAQ